MVEGVKKEIHGVLEGAEYHEEIFSRGRYAVFSEVMRRGVCAEV